MRIRPRRIEPASLNKLAQRLLHTVSIEIHGTERHVELGRAAGLSESSLERENRSIPLGECHVQRLDARSHAWSFVAESSCQRHRELTQRSYEDLLPLVGLGDRRPGLFRRQLGGQWCDGHYGHDEREQ
jgi:hypothetical protein